MAFKPFSQDDTRVALLVSASEFRVKEIDRRIAEGIKVRGRGDLQRKALHYL